LDGTCPAPGGLSKKLHAKAAAEKQQSITLVNQSFDERKIVVLRPDASDKKAKQNESDDHFRLADNRWADHSGCHAGVQWDVSIA
jgi:hypothetical protein